LGLDEFYSTMQYRTIRIFIWVLFSALVVFFIGGCGSGGGSGGGAVTGARAEPPYILATVMSFRAEAVPPGFVDTPFNSAVTVEVRDKAGGIPRPDASVTLNGVALTYIPDYQDYEGQTFVAPAGSVKLSVTVGGATYTASGTQFTSYPSISSPLSGATWSAQDTNLIVWSSVSRSANSLYVLGIVDTDGQVIGLSGNDIQFLPTTSTSFTIGSGSLTIGTESVVVGIATAVSIPSAAPDSSIVIGGFNFVPITVDSGPTAALVSIAVTPATPTVSVAKTLQLTATGTYSDSNTRDLTSQVTWTSSDLGKATVNASGMVTGIGYGSATITASLGPVPPTPAIVNIFKPNPSPVPPLSQAVAYQIDYAHSGFATFGTPLMFPSIPTWSVTLDGPASYPLIVDGKVFVTTLTSVYALDKLTGMVVWGPVAIPGTSWLGHAYDHGKLFVVNDGGMLRSFDAATGQAGWSTKLPGQYAFSSPPTAVNGVIYVGGAGSAGTLYAVDESTGNVYGRHLSRAVIIVHLRYRMTAYLSPIPAKSTSSTL
jgi:hypothetical protein